MTENESRIYTRVNDGLAVELLDWIATETTIKCYGNIVAGATYFETWSVSFNTYLDSHNDPDSLCPDAQLVTPNEFKRIAKERLGK